VAAKGCIQCWVLLSAPARRIHDRRMTRIRSWQVGRIATGVTIRLSTGWWVAARRIAWTGIGLIGTGARRPAGPNL
jgi:hypothetical protein